MQTTLISGVALAALTLAACGGETPPPQPPPAPPPPPPAAASAAPAPTDTSPPAPTPKPVLSEVMPGVIKGIFDASNAHDDPKEASFLSDDYVQTSYGGYEIHGKATYLEGATKSAQRFTDTKWAAPRVWTTGNVAVVECMWTGSISANPPADSVRNGEMKNSPMGVKRAEVYVFRDDGLVNERRIYVNGLGVRAQARGWKNAPPVEPLPTGPSEVHAAKGSPDEDKLVDWAKRFEDALNTKDVAQVTALLADDVESDTWGLPPIKGKKDNAKDLQSLFKAFPDQTWTPTNVWGVDGFVVIEHVFTGTQKLPYRQLTKVTGKPVTGQHFLEIWQPNADGKLTHRWTYSNPSEALKQTGGTESAPPVAPGK